ncbi:retrovirus-related pol polyprotein from transposon TNT 1-94 [Tanacetum coccineum]
MGLWYPKDYGFETNSIFRRLDHAMPYIGKATSRGIQFPWCKLVSGCQRKQNACNVFSRGKVRGVICKLCSSNVDEDTTSRLWLQLQQNTIVLRLSVSHSNIMQPRTAFANKAHPYSGIMPTKIELALEQSQHGVSNDVLKTNPIVIPESEKTLMLAKESRSKMLLKQKDPIMLEKKVNTTPVDYAALNQLYKDFETRFVPQTKLSAEQAFWSQNSVNSLEPSLSSRPTIVEVPKELPKVSMVNTSLKKLKNHLAGFDVVVKERTTPTAITEGSWGKDIVNSSVNNASVNVHECEKCLQLKTELQTDFIEKEIYDKLFKSFTTLEKHCISLEVDSQLNQEIFQRDNPVSNQSAPSFDQLFELNELKAQSQEKDTVIKKLKERIKSLCGKQNEDKIKKDLEEIETINIELDHRVTKLIAENEHLKQTYKQLYDSIKPARIRSKEQCDDLINQVNLKKLKGKALVDNDVTKHPSNPEMLKIDMEPITPKLLNKQTAHFAYIKHTQEEATVLKSKYLLDQSLEYSCRYAKLVQEFLTNISKTCPSVNNTDGKLVAVTPKNKDKRVRFTEPKNKVEAHPRKVKSSLKNKDCVVEPKGTAHVQNSKLNTNSELKCVKCNGCMLYDNHDLCVLDFINNVNAHNKSKSVKQSSKRKVWEPTGKVFTNIRYIWRPTSRKIGYIWRPTGRTFTIVGNACPLTRITTTIEVPHRKPTTLENETPKPIVTLVYLRKPRKSNSNVPDSKTKVPKTLSANKKEPSQSRGSKVSNVPSSSLIECKSSKLFSVKFGNDHVVKILGYGDYQIGNVTILRVYYVEGFGHNLFSVRKFCYSNLKVAFRQHTCFIRNFKGVDLLTGSRGKNLYTLSLGDMMTSSPICLLSKASKTKSWLWHRRLSHLNFGAINHLARHGLVHGLPKLKFKKDHLCSACAMGKSKKKPHKPKSKDTNQEKLYLLHMDLCGPMCVASVNGKKYIIVIVDDYSRFTWVKHLRSKDEAPDFIIKFLKMIQTGISHEISVARSPQQNGVVKRRNRTLIEAARTMLIYAKALLFFWAEAVATACYTQNRSIIHLRHGKTPYELLHDKPPDLSFFHIFGALCYPTNDCENLGKLQPKADIDFDELTAMASEHSSSGPALHEMTPATISSGLVLNPPPSTPFVPPSRTDLDILFQPMFDELLTPLPSVDLPALEVIAQIDEVVALVPAVSTGSPSSTIVDQDAPSPSNSQTTRETQSPVIPNDVEVDNHDIEVAHMGNDSYFGILISEVPSDQSSSMDSIHIIVHPDHQISEHNKKWTKDHPLENKISKLDRTVSTRLQLHEQALFCYYDAFLATVEPKTYKDTLTQS